MSFIGELQRRKVFKVGAAYAVVAWLLIQIAVTILPTFNAPEWITQTVVFLLILGLPIALLLAWAYELTPEGIRPTSALAGPLAPQRKLLIASYAAAGLLAIVASFVVVTSYVFRPEPAAPTTAANAAPAQTAPAGSAGAAVPPSVAVLPFEDLSETGDQDFRTFAAGTLDEANPAGARRVYARMFPALLGSGDIPVNALNVHAAVDVAWMLQSQGEAERAEALLERCLAVLRDRRGVFAELHLTQARALALLGRQPEALASLRRGIERGHYWWLAESDPALAELGPELGALIADANAAAAARLAGSTGLSN